MYIGDRWGKRPHRIYHKGVTVKNIGQAIDRKLKNMEGKKIVFKMNLFIPAVIMLSIGFIFGLKGWVIAGFIVFLAPYLLIGFSFMVLILAESLGAGEPRKRK